jgi:hypothetical protein
MMLFSWVFPCFCKYQEFEHLGSSVIVQLVVVRGNSQVEAGQKFDREDCGQVS